MDTTFIPLLSEMGKVPSPIASPKSGKSRPNVGKPVQDEFELKNPRLVPSRGEMVPLAKAVPNSENMKVAEREGFEPPVPCGTPDFESGAIDHSATSPYNTRQQ
jgi:hypothetical protein